MSKKNVYTHRKKYNENFNRIVNTSLWREREKNRFSGGFFRGTSNKYHFYGYLYHFCGNTLI